MKQKRLHSLHKTKDIPATAIKGSQKGIKDEENISMKMHRQSVSNYVTQSIRNPLFSRSAKDIKDGNKTRIAGNV